MQSKTISDIKDFWISNYRASPVVAFLKGEVGLARTFWYSLAIGVIFGLVTDVMRAAIGTENMPFVLGWILYLAPFFLNLLLLGALANAAMKHKGRKIYQHLAMFWVFAGYAVTALGVMFFGSVNIYTLTDVTISSLISRWS